jgi:hypothetical protein
MIYFTSILWFPSDRQHTHYFTLVELSSFKVVWFSYSFSNQSSKPQQQEYAVTIIYLTVLIRSASSTQIVKAAEKKTAEWS